MCEWEHLREWVHLLRRSICASVSGCIYQRVRVCVHVMLVSAYEFECMRVRSGVTAFEGVKVQAGYRL